MKKSGVLTAMAICAITSISAMADIKMSAVFSDNMVFQQGISVPVWGWSEPGEKVEVSFSGQQKSAIAGNDGKWMLKLDPMKASFSPAEVTVHCGSFTKSFSNILVGEVWLASGQSNMAFSMSSLANAAEEIEHADYPSIRILNIPRKCLPAPQKSFESAGWTKCTPATVKDFSAAGYFFGRKLFRDLNVPVGIINCSWPGSLIEAWTPKESFAPGVQAGIEKRSMEFAQLSGADRKRIAEKFAKSDFAVTYYKNRLKDGLPKDAEAEEFFFYYSYWTSESCMYNGMLHPLIPYSIRGIIWYQGEQNVKDTDYSMKQQRLVKAWRESWGEGDFPFYITQITPIKGGPQPAFWLQQYDAASKIKNSGIISTVDIGDLHDAHPKNKKDVGERLARLALRNTYDRQNVICSGPRFKALHQNGSKLEVEFDDGGAPLATRDGKAPDSFEIAGDDMKFYKATAEINGSSVILSAPELQHPQYARFAWTCETLPNFGNREGLPAFPFNSALK